MLGSPLTSLPGQHGVLSADIAVNRSAQRAGVQDKAAHLTLGPADVRVSAHQHWLVELGEGRVQAELRIIQGQQAGLLVLRHGDRVAIWEKELCDASWRPVDNTDRRCAINCNDTLFWQGGHETQRLAIELPVRPAQTSPLDAHVPAFWGISPVVGEQVVLPVAADHPAAKGPQDTNCFEGLGPVDKVAGHDDAIHTLEFHVSQHGLEGGQISVDVGQDR